MTSNWPGLQRLVDHWYRHSRWLLLLVPVSLVYRLASATRRLLYRAGLLKSSRLPVPVIVVGNLSVGGTGKTPLVAWLAEQLGRAGRCPGIVARGYGGQARRWPQRVRPDSDPLMVGDEAVLLAARTGCPVAVGPDRVAAARTLLEDGGCDVILSDDGLQHYALQRDIEIAVIDGARRFGNGFCLPAGPLREPLRRLALVDLVVVNGPGRQGEYSMTMCPEEAHDLMGEQPPRGLDSFRGQPVHAVAGIGNPGRFFDMLRRAGLGISEHAFPDHHRYSAGDIRFGDGLPVIMTEKDAVKCRQLAVQNCWYAPVTIVLPREFAVRVSALLAGLA